MPKYKVEVEVAQFFELEVEAESEEEAEQIAMTTYYKDSILTDEFVNQVTIDEVYE